MRMWKLLGFLLFLVAKVSVAGIDHESARVLGKVVKFDKDFVFLKWAGGTKKIERKLLGRASKDVKPNQEIYFFLNKKEFKLYQKKAKIKGAKR